jgi:hypothetical protein
MTDDRVFEVRISGLVSAEVLLELEDVEATAHEMRTVLVGRFQDQAALYGFLHRVRAYGLDIVEVRQIVTGDVEQAPSES